MYKSVASLDLGPQCRRGDGDLVEGAECPRSETLESHEHAEDVKHAVSHFEQSLTKAPMEDHLRLIAV